MKKKLILILTIAALSLFTVIMICAGTAGRNTGCIIALFMILLLAIFACVCFIVYYLSNISYALNGKHNDGEDKKKKEVKNKKEENQTQD